MYFIFFYCHLGKNFFYSQIQADICLCSASSERSQETLGILKKQDLILSFTLFFQTIFARRLY